ncbi:SpaH/EbpB family LPXTG-anchored major pilin [Leifsonia sp. 2MCAF36]|uniref:SpaH/EbpB family LPXTG-anchored major pilin n=1 Tax=Leifsonia sp. 2MCAF36 TaxID=3232988 RepID=UPI003F9C996C
MTKNTRQRGRTALAVGTMLSLGVLGTLATNTAANAASIDTAQQGSIIIHKYTNPGNGDQNASGTGTEPNTAPIAGVVFEYCAIAGIDLLDNTNTGWDAVNAITPTAKQAAAAQGTTQLGSHTLTGCTSMPATDAAGTSTTAKLPLGAYFVREISAPANVATLAAPFIVTLPTPQDAKSLTGDWVYDVNVYPKNTTAQGPVKNVVKQEANGGLLGAPVQYEVTQLVPALATGQPYTKFIMTETLDAKLTPGTAPVTVKAGSTTLTSGAEYTATWSGQSLTVTLTPAGLGKLQGGENVVIGFQATANAPGSIDNQVFVNLNDLTLTPGTPNGTDGSPSTTATTRWGDLTVQKVNAANMADGLSGATFEVYMGTTDQSPGCTADITGLQQITVPGSGAPFVATSSATGTITIAGLWIGDTEKTVAADGTVSNTTVAGHDLVQRCYVLKEIAAPNGFVLPTGVAALTAVMVKAGTNGVVPLVTINNTQQGVPQLPFTGSSVQLALTIGGIALLIIALGGVLVVRRRAARRENS